MAGVTGQADGWKAPRMAGVTGGANMTVGTETGRHLGEAQPSNDGTGGKQEALGHGEDPGHGEDRAGQEERGNQEEREDWGELVAAALLGAERRRPPGGSVTALLDAAATGTVRRRAGVRPAVPGQ
ncbi:hypothetical protein AN220_16245, partial [Streptomyces nanshensis]